MKKLFALILCIAMILPSTVAFAEQPIKIIVGGKVLKTDIEPVVESGRVLVPVRHIFEALGADVTYDAKTKGITAKKGSKTVKLTLNSKTMTVGGKKKSLDVPAKAANNRTLVPVRACAEAFDCIVEWSSSTRTVKIRTGEWVLIEKKSANGKILAKNTLDDRGRIIRSETPDGSAVPNYNVDERTYDDHDNLLKIEITDYAGNVMREEYKYDAKGNMTKYTDGYDVERYQYDSNGNMVYSYDNYGNWEKYKYDKNNNKIYMEDSEGYWEKYTYDNCHNLLSSEDVDGYKMRFEYDERNNCIYEESDGPYGTFYTKYEYDKNGNMTYFEQQQSYGVYWKKYTYDSQNRLTKWVDSRGFRETSEYDSKGNCTTYDNCGAVASTSKYVYVVR